MMRFLCLLVLAMTLAAQGPELVQKLADMSPEAREKALAALPAKRREKLEERIREFQSLPPEQQRNMRARAAKLAALPPERQEEVRASLRTFTELPEDRRIAIRREVRHPKPVHDPARDPFSPAERRIIRDLREVAPDDPPAPNGRGR